ncbi:hypothetical protein AB835_08540 [Candidatus Endobugula sertula]|uniref:DUF501 domain-containing protein n=1 Tax=Candidatus Endobugula sertula TaxID=62101 RepID=A0A1D2QPH9_9GAMM|nr:hypothetical protein AB835_08540 [Candidatus Endobugula sertula]
MSLSESDVSIIATLLGREPRGLEDIVCRDKQGAPMVIRVAPLVDNKPFPTLFWLVDQQLNYAIDTLEASGLIAKFQSQVDGSEQIQKQLAMNHQQYIQLRQSFITEAQRRQINELRFNEVLEQRGIGGIADFQRIRCLHTYYAAHLVQANSIGRLLETYWQQIGVSFDHFDYVG